MITFESAPVGSFSILTVAPGVVMSGADQNGANHTINNTPAYPTAPALDGFNTTASGANYVEMIGGTLTFTFATPTQYFGAYFTGVQPNFFNDVITFNDGAAQSLSLISNSTSAGGVLFFGFTDVGKSISSVTIYTGNAANADYIGVDDVRFQPASVPEPASMTLCLVAGAAMIGYGRRKRV